MREHPREGSDKSDDLPSFASSNLSLSSFIACRVVECHKMAAFMGLSPFDSIPQLVYTEMALCNNILASVNITLDFTKELFFCLSAPVSRAVGFFNKLRIAKYLQRSVVERQHYRSSFLHDGVAPSTIHISLFYDQQ
jgi:hypothetical protein